MKRATDLLDVSVEDIPTRLTFLRMLRERTVFEDHAVLKLIIGDYERAQRAAWSREENPGRRRTDARPAPVQPRQAAGRSVRIVGSDAPATLTLSITGLARGLPIKAESGGEKVAKGGEPSP